MALSNYQSYVDKVNTAQRWGFVKELGSAGNTSVHFSMWTSSPNAGVAPSTAVAPDKDTLGSLFRNPVPQAVTNDLYAAQLHTAIAYQNTNGSTFAMMLCDRLSHQGGLSGTVTTPQTTNLPTAALTRYTSGEGVFAALEIYTQVGSTGTTATLSYTNQAGTAGRTSKPVVIGAATFREATYFIVAPLQDGDTGVRSVESVTLAASTVSTAGNFGVTLFKPVFINAPGLFAPANSVRQNYKDAVIGGGGSLVTLDESGCYFFTLCTAEAIASNKPVMGELVAIEVA